MIELLNGDCIEQMGLIIDNSVDAVVTDPPYGLSFMGKHWDYDVPNVDVWREVFRVLKPGGYLLSFGGTRTYHRMACAIEDAGFEIRDMVEWLYGSGFPKSLDIGKAVDKLRGNERQDLGESDNNRDRSTHEYNSVGNVGSNARITKGTSEWEGWGTALKPAHESICVAQKRVQSSSDYEDYFVSLLKQIKRELCQYQSFAQTAERNLRLNPKGSRGVVDIAQWLAEENINIQEDLSVLTATLQSESEINSSWSIVLSWLNTLADLSSMMNTYTTLTELRMTTELSILNSLEWGSIFQNITQAPSSNPDGSYASVCIVEDILSVVGLKLNDIRTRFVQGDVTSMEGKRASAPNIEPICMARKPLSEKTIAENVLKHGTGGINIDECRIAVNPDIDDKRLGGKGDWSSEKMAKNVYEGGYKGERVGSSALGRFPANVIHDGSEVVVSEFPQSSVTGVRHKPHIATGAKNTPFTMGNPLAEYTDSGSAARFFYCAKASKSERDKGLQDSKWFYGLELIVNNRIFAETDIYLWENQGQNQDTDSSGEVPPPRGISGDTMLIAVDSEWNTYSYGNNITGIFPTGISYITETGIRRTIGLKTSSYYQHLTISDCIQDVIKTTTENGLNLAENVGLKNLLNLIFIKDQMGYPRGVRVVARKMPRSISVKDAWPKKNIHSTVKPVALMRYLCRMVTPKGGIVLDPFMGSGTTGIAAKVEGYSFIGIEREEEYCRIAEARIAAWEEGKIVEDTQQTLF